MFEGTFKFVARVNGVGITFSTCRGKSNMLGGEGDDWIELEGADGHSIHVTVHLVCAITKEQGEQDALSIANKALDRISYRLDTAISCASLTDSTFTPRDERHSTPAIEIGAHVHFKQSVKCIVNRTSESMKAILEESPSGSERYSGHFRSALLASGPVEEFMALYHILLMLCDDKQTEVDEFILRHEPFVPKSPSPKRKNIDETIYTRLRNEFAHCRKSVKLSSTKSEIEDRVCRLRALTKRAIEGKV